MSNILKIVIFVVAEILLNRLVGLIFLFMEKSTILSTCVSPKVR